MKGILVSFIISLILAIIVSIVNQLFKKLTKKQVIRTMVVIVVAGTLAGMINSTTNCSEYKEWQIVSETEIFPLSASGEKIIYTRLLENGKYRYKYEINEISFWSETAKQYDYNSIEATLVEDINCEVPAIIIYEREPVKGEFFSWTLGTFAKTEVKYVIYVPAGTVES